MIVLRGSSSHSFAKFVAKKAVFYLIVTFVALNLIFFIKTYGGANLSSPPYWPSPPYWDPPYDLIIAYREWFGFDKPLIVQYVNFWGQIFTGNWGPSSSQWPTPVSQIALAGLPYTLALVIPVLIISFVLGNWIGAKAAFMGGKRSKLVYFFSVFSNRLPTFWFGMVLVFVFVGKLHLFPTFGRYLSKGVTLDGSLESYLDLFYHYLLPFFTLLTVYLGGWATGMRSMVLHEMDSGYVRYSEQLGFKKNKSISYAKRDAILHQFTGLNLYFTALVGETVILEVILGWPGIGKLMFNYILQDEYPVIQGTFLIMMIVAILGNFLIDIAHGFIDPRIRNRNEQ